MNYEDLNTLSGPVSRRCRPQLDSGYIPGCHEPCRLELCLPSGGDKSFACLGHSQHILASMTEEQKEIALNELKRRNEGSADARETVLITTDDGFNILYRQFSHFSYTFDLQNTDYFRVTPRFFAVCNGLQPYALVRSGRVRGRFPQHNKAPAGGSSCRGLRCRILPELTGKLQFLLRREQFIERVAFRLVYKVALWRSIFAVDAIEIA